MPQRIPNLHEYCGVGGAYSNSCYGSSRKLFQYLYTFCSIAVFVKEFLSTVHQNFYSLSRLPLESYGSVAVKLAFHINRVSKGLLSARLCPLAGCWARCLSSDLKHPTIGAAGIALAVTDNRKSIPTPGRCLAKRDAFLIPPKPRPARTRIPASAAWTSA